MLRPLALTFAFTVVVMTVAFSSPEPVTAPEVIPALAKGSAETEAAKPKPSGDFEIPRDSSGRFHLTADVNGEQAPFLLDTGADIVALTVNDAERLGIPFNRDDFHPVAETASGTGMGTTVRIETMTVADQEFRDVRALVIDGLKTNLIGQSLLRKLGSIELHSDRLIVRRG
jgi:aspartyl protease family protein